MEQEEEKDYRLYYPIRDVSNMIGVNASTLRYWEKEFKELRPRTTPGGTRLYSMKDIDYLRLIHSLLKEKKMKIEGARELLKSKHSQLEQKQKIIDKLDSIKMQLLELKEDLF